MKKILSLALALVMMACMLAAPVSALTANGSYGEVPLTKDPIVIDGKVDEAYEKIGLKIAVDKDFSEKYATDTVADLYMLHDGTYIYAAVAVKSANPLTDYPKLDDAAKLNNGSAYKSTCAEFMFDFSNDGVDDKGGPDIFKATGWFDGQVWGSKLADPANKSDFIADYKATVDKTAKTFVLEFKLKMQEGATSGKEIGINLMITSNADMASPKQDQIACINPGNSNNASKFLNVTLGTAEKTIIVPETTKAPETTAAPKTEPAAPATFDAAVVIAVVAAAAGAGVVVSKKRH